MMVVIYAFGMYCGCDRVGVPGPPSSRRMLRDEVTERLDSCFRIATRYALRSGDSSELELRGVSRLVSSNIEPSTAVELFKFVCSAYKLLTNMLKQTLNTAKVAHTEEIL